MPCALEMSLKPRSEGRGAFPGPGGPVGGCWPAAVSCPRAGCAAGSDPAGQWCRPRPTD